MYLYYYILERFALGEESKKELQIYNTLDQKPDNYNPVNPYENAGRPTWRMFKLHTLCKPHLPDYPISYDILESFGVYGEKITKPNIYYCNITKVHIELPTFELKKLLNFFKEDVYPIYLTKKQELIDLDTSSNQL